MALNTELKTFTVGVPSLKLSTYKPQLHLVLQELRQLLHKELTLTSLGQHLHLLEALEFP